MKVRVAEVKSTSVMVAVHLRFGQTTAGLGAGGSAGVTSKEVRPFLPWMSDCDPDAFPDVSCPGATLPAGFVQVTEPVPVASSTTVRFSLPRPDTFPVTLRVVPSSVKVGPAWNLMADWAALGMNASAQAARITTSSFFMSYLR